MLRSTLSKRKNPQLTTFPVTFTVVRNNRCHHVRHTFFFPHFDLVLTEAWVAASNHGPACSIIDTSSNPAAPYAPPRVVPGVRARSTPGSGTRGRGAIFHVYSVLIEMGVEASPAERTCGASVWFMVPSQSTSCEAKVEGEEDASKYEICAQGEHE